MLYLEVQPQTRIYLCKGIPFDNTYSHVRLFDDRINRLSYFNSKVSATMLNATYQRTHDKIRMRASFEEVADCNYLYFQNISDGKYWFCFITSIEFVNQNMCDVSFEVDVFQTWFNESFVKPSFIERQHTNDDTIGANLLPEGLETGEYVFNTGVFDSQYNDLVTLTPCIMVAVSELPEDAPVEPAFIVDHTFTGLSYYHADMSYAQYVKDLVESYAQAGKADAIVSIFMFPREFIVSSPSDPDSYGWLPASYNKTNVLKGGNVANLTAPLNGYTPKNNKLFTYPYRAIELYGSGGGAHEYRYEFFNSYTDMFSVFSTFGGSAPINAVPNNYKNLTINLEEVTSMNPYPTCSWVNDNYKNWYAQNILGLTLSTGMSAGGALLGAVGNIMTGNIGGAIGSVTGGLNTVLNNIVSVEQHSIIPDTAKGTVASSASYFANGQYYFYLFPKCIKAEFARSIDNFFSMYGYKTNMTAKPNITGRKSWNYVKLSEANLSGDMPHEAYLIIKSSLEKGVTFWHTNDMLNYTLDNSIV